MVTISTNEGMVVTTLEARVAPDRHAALVRDYGNAGDELPPAIVESFPLDDEDTDRWRMVTVWRSIQALDAYRASVDTPQGVVMFRAAGVEPTLTISAVAFHAGQPPERSDRP